MISLIAFIVAAVLYAIAGLGEADVSIWGHFGVAVGLAFGGAGDPRGWFKR